jgi:hypothetical protein
MEQSNQWTKNIDYTGEEIQNYIALFVGEKFNTYYKKVWENKYDKEWFLSFNIPAFFLNGLWFFYRKMYIEGIICNAVIIFFGNIVFKPFYRYFPNIFSANVLQLFLYLFSSVIFGFLGNYLYLRNVKINISKLIKEKDSKNIMEYLEKRKCTNLKIVIILVVTGILLVALYFSIVFYFLYLLFSR